MTIGELAKATGLEKTAIRYYEEKELIKPLRMENGYRKYSDKDIADIQLIQMLKLAGLSLKDIQLLLTLKNEPFSLTCKESSIDFIQKQLKKISETIQRMQKLQLTLNNILGIVEENEDNLGLIKQELKQLSDEGE